MSVPFVMGVDPGTRASAFAVVQGERLVDYERLEKILPAEWTDEDLGAALERYCLWIREGLQAHGCALLVVEHTSFPRNAHTQKLLDYLEAAALMAAAKGGILAMRMRTTTARKQALRDGGMKKEAVVWRVRERYESLFTEDEAEAVVFALAGAGVLQSSP